MSFPTLPPGMGWPFVDATTGEFQSEAVKDWLHALVVSQIPARGVRTSPPVGALVQKLAAGVEAGYMIGVGDSTMSASQGWFNQGVEWLAEQFPAYTVLRRDWSDANQRYELVPTTIQTGSAGARRFVATGASTDRFFTVPDSASTSPSSAVRAEFDVMIPAFGAAITLGGKYVTTTDNRAWFVQINADGTISFFTSSDGTAATQVQRTSTATIPSGLAGQRITLRVNFIGDNSASGHNVSFYYSTNQGSSWTQIGSTVVTAGTRTIFNSTAATQLNGRGGAANSTGGAVQYYGLKVFSLLTETVRPIIDFYTGQWNGYGSNATAGSNIAQFTDFVGNTVQIDGTGQGGAMTGAPVLYVLNGAVSGQTISYANDGTRFPKLVPLAADLVVINFSHNEVGLIDYRTPYKTLADAIIAKGPDTGVIATVQNQRFAPATNIAEHAIRGDRIRALAGSEGYALVDIAAAFTATGHPEELVDADGIHPNADGYEVATAEFVVLFDAYLRAA